MNYRIPLDYPQINNINAHYAPSCVKAFNNQYFGYWQRTLLQRLQSVFKLNVPWSAAEYDFLNFCLFSFGYVGVMYEKEYGLIFQPGTISGRNLYYQPTKLLVCNPAFEPNASREYTIDEDCILLRLTPDYLGLFDVINRFAEKLAGMDSAINMSIINNRLAYVISASTKAGAESLKKVLDKVSKGEPTVVYDKRICVDPQSKDQPFQVLDVKNTYITNQQLQDLQSILNSFDAEVGIPTVPYQKKERMVTSEAESRIIDSTARAKVWLNCLNESFELINAKFGTNMSAELRFDPDQEEGDNNE